VLLSKILRQFEFIRRDPALCVKLFGYLQVGFVLFAFCRLFCGVAGPGCKRVSIYTDITAADSQKLS
jgi:hypothetical protein